MLTLDSDRVVEASQEHETLVFAVGEVREFLFAFGEPLVVALDGDDAALGTAESCPHAAALDEGFGSGVDGVERDVLRFTPVGYKTPLHGVEDELVVCVAQDGRVRAGSDVVARHKVVLIVPDVDWGERVAWKASYCVVLRVCEWIILFQKQHARGEKVQSGRTWIAHERGNKIGF